MIDHVIVPFLGQVLPWLGLAFAGWLWYLRDPRPVDPEIEELARVWGFHRRTR